METILQTIKKIDFLLILSPLLLGAFSVIMINSITSGGGSYSRAVLVQALAFGLGLLAMTAAALMDPVFLYRLKWLFYALCFVLQLTVFIPGLAVDAATTGGQQAWINLGITTMQPSELVKITFIVFLASWLDEKRETLFTFKGFLRTAVPALPVIALVASIDMGAGVVHFFIFVGMVFAAGLRGRLFGQLAAAFFISTPIIYRFLADHQKSRFEAVLHPSNTELKETWQLLQSKTAIGSGGLFGKGLGNGTVKESGLVPVQESDFIFSIICEETGFVGGMAVILIYALFLFRIWRTVTQAREVSGALVCVGFLCMFGFQIFENIGMTLGIMPIAGITLPFLSAGGTSVIANMIGVGLIIGIGVRSKAKTYKHISTETAM
ncbi:MAG: FtsW/RodA/SpoVE family cell cycle protein [Clostridiales Family XIII bacterium]|jgi:rod shape determining protein RodA|nr:FtsW/RodA/SpoVE family cell cycle protein [Clostridiales Family XIII bacterium]